MTGQCKDRERAVSVNSEHVHCPILTLPSKIQVQIFVKLFPNCRILFNNVYLVLLILLVILLLVFVLVSVRFLGCS